MKTEQESKNQGISLYLTIVVLSIILSLAMGMSTLLFYQAKTLQDIGYSVSAYYAAETGVEKALYGLSLDPPESGPWTGTLSNNASFETTYLLPGNGGCPASVVYCLKSIGSYKQVKRGIRIAR